MFLSRMNKSFTEDCMKAINCFQNKRSSYSDFIITLLYDLYKDDIEKSDIDVVITLINERKEFPVLYEKLLQLFNTPKNIDTRQAVSEISHRLGQIYEHCVATVIGNKKGLNSNNN